MKLFLAIFTIYFLALSCKPCEDLKDCQYSSKGEITSHSDHSDHEGDSENCSPFCMCSCCGQTFSFNYIPLELNNNGDISFLEVSIYESTLISEFYISIWQPPKIS